MKRINIVCAIITALVLILGGVYVYKYKIKADRTPPTIQCTQDTIECSISATNEELCAGLTASDDRDGDITGQIMVNDIKMKNTSDDTSDKTFDISYVVFDSSSNMATYSRTLVYTDYESPKFDITTPLIYTSVADANMYLQSSLTVTDCIDGDISSQVTLEMSEEYLNSENGTGSFDCTASVTNSLGDTVSIPLIIDIYPDDSDSSGEQVRPVIYLTKYIIYKHVGHHVDPNKYLSQLIIDSTSYNLIDGSLTDLTEAPMERELGYYNEELGAFMFKSDIKIKSNVEKDEAGVYNITYSYKDPDTDKTGKAHLIVVMQPEESEKKK